MFVGSALNLLLAFIFLVSLCSEASIYHIYDNELLGEDSVWELICNAGTKLHRKLVEPFEFLLPV